jgi:hypothetical protein
MIQGQNTSTIRAKAYGQTIVFAHEYLAESYHHALQILL